MAGQDWVSTSMPYLVPGAGDPWAAEAAARGARGTQRITHAGEVPAPTTVAELLGLADGEAVVVRRRTIYLDEVAVETADSYFPVQVARGTRLVERGRIPGGAVSLLRDRGYAAHAVQEDVTARRPDAAECRVFSIGDGDPLLVLTRLVSDTDGRPFQVDVLTAPAGLRRYRYQVTVH